MSWKNIKLIFMREVRDQLRDRRTLFMVAVLPLLLYPALGIGMVQMTVTFEEQQRSVIIVGADEIPPPQLIDGDHFEESLFPDPLESAKLLVVTDHTGAVDQLPIHQERKEEFSLFFQLLKQHMHELQRLSELQLMKGEAEEPDSELLSEQAQLRQRATQLLAAGPADVVILFPKGFRTQYEEVSEKLRSNVAGANEELHLPHPLVLHNSAKERSDIAYQRTRRVIQAWEQAVLESRLAEMGLPVSFDDPIGITEVDLAKPEEISANVWSKVFPTLLVIMAVTGAFYPAIDLGAGEKERGTMETLLISPATRAEIVLGKFLTVMLFSISTALLNLTSMGFTGKHMFAAMTQGATSAFGSIAFPPFSSLIWVVLLAFPLSALFSALSLSLAMFAKSSKEGQYYLTPLLMVTMGLTMFCLNPSVELTPYYSILPVVGPSLLLKSLLLEGPASGAVVSYILPVLVMSITYSGIALWWAIEQFQSENILFKASEKFDIGLWIKQLLNTKSATPSFSEAAVCFVVIGMLQFLFLTSVQSAPGMLEGPIGIVKTQLIYLIATVGFPPIVMALLLTSNFRKSLKLTLPNWKYLAAAVVLPFSLQPLALELLDLLDPFFPPVPAGAAQVMQAMGTDQVPFLLAMLTFAIAPAVCEELAFRGFILSGLQRSRFQWLPIVVSALLFGVIHMIPKQQFNAALLGLVLGLLAVRSRSLLPGVIFHAIFNGTQVYASRNAEVVTQVLGGFVLRESPSGDIVEQMSFQPLFLVICGAVSVSVLYWLFHSKESSANANSTAALGQLVAKTP